MSRIDQYNETVWVEDTTDAISAIYQGVESGQPDRRMFIVGRRGEYVKWAIFDCPCGHGAPIMINLMAGQQSSVWTFEEHEDGTVTLNPSVLLGGVCSSHFYIRRSKVDWC